VKISKKIDKLIYNVLFIRICNDDHEELEQDGNAEESGADFRQNAPAADQKQEHSGRQQRGNDQKSRADVRRKKRELRPLISKISDTYQKYNVFPFVRAISGSRFAPKNSRANRKTRIICPIPMPILFFS